MITDTFDPVTEAIISPHLKDGAPEVAAAIVTFSHVIEEFVLANYPHEQIGLCTGCTGDLPVWRIRFNGKDFAFMKTYAGAPACVATLEDTLSQIRCTKYILFGGAGCLNREIAHGKVMIPTAAWRDEGTSYHYASAADWIAIRNHAAVEECMKANGIPCVSGRTWTTDAFYRETRGNFAKRKTAGCISVEMECAAVQAMCDLRGLDAYFFFTGGDLLDAPEWDTRRKNGSFQGTQHDAGHFDIALALADRVTE